MSKIKKQYHLYTMRGDHLHSAPIEALVQYISKHSGYKVSSQQLYTAQSKGAIVKGYRVLSKYTPKAVCNTYGFGEMSPVYRYNNEVLVAKYDNFKEASIATGVGMDSLKEHLYYNIPLENEGMVFKPYKKSLTDFARIPRTKFEGEVYSLAGEHLYSFDSRQDLSCKLNSDIGRTLSNYIGNNSVMACNRSVEITFGVYA